MIRKSESGIDEWDIHIAQHFDWPKFPYRALLPTSNHHWHYIFPDPNLQAGLPWNADSLREAIRNGDAVALSVGELVMLAGDFYSSFEEMEKGPSRDPLNIMLGVKQSKPLAGMIFDAAKWNAGAGGFDVGAYLPSPLEKLTLPPDPSPIEALAIKDQMQWVSDRAREGKDEVEWELLKPLAELLRSIAGTTSYSEMHALAQLLPQGAADRTLDKMLPKLPWTKHTDWRAFLRRENSSPRMRTMISRLSATPVADEAFSIAVTNGRYPHLALHNNPHFSPDNWTAFERYHRRALHTVAGHMRAAPSAFRTSPIPAEAIALTAFGLHFLTDSFSAGHMRVPRAALGLSGALAAKVMHDLDGYYGLTVANGFHDKWHAYGDDHLRAESLDPEQKLILKLLEMREPLINAEAGTNARRASEAVAAAFQQLHQEAQRYWSPMSVWEVGACLERPVDYSKAVHIALALNRDDEGLLHENLAPARSALSKSLDKILAASIDEKIRVMKMHVPRYEDVGMEASQNPPPLFFENDAGEIQVSQADIGGAGARAYTLTMALGIKRGMHLKWHPSPRDRPEDHRSGCRFHQPLLPRGIRRGSGQRGLDRSRRETHLRPLRSFAPRYRGRRQIPLTGPLAPAVTVRPSLSRRSCARSLSHPSILPARNLGRYTHESALRHSLRQGANPLPMTFLAHTPFRRVHPRAQLSISVIARVRSCGTDVTKRPAVPSWGNSRQFRNGCGVRRKDKIMKIVVIGGTGLYLARSLSKNLLHNGQEVVAASPATGVNTITGDGLARALQDASAVVDVTNSPSWEDAAVLKFFETSTRNLLDYEAAAGVGHHVASCRSSPPNVCSKAVFSAPKSFRKT